MLHRVRHRIGRELPGDDALCGASPPIEILECFLSLTTAGEMQTAKSSLFACKRCTRDLFSSFRLDIAAQSIPRQSRRHFSRPSNAPKPQLDIKHIRQNPGLYEQNCIDRNYKRQARNSWRILELHEQWQESQSTTKRLRERQNALKQTIMKAKGDAAERSAAVDEARVLKEHLSGVLEKEEELQATIQELALELPNLSSTQTPVGEEPEVLSYIGEHPDAALGDDTTKRKTISHVEIGERLNLLDFASASTTSGWGWYYLLNSAALLEQALVQYAIHTCMQMGWKVVSPPSMVYEHMSSACGFQPRDQNGETQVYSLEQPARHQAQGDEKQARPRHVLAGTAEIPLAGLKANMVFDEAELPLKVVGVSRCYRAEAGARGVDTKGLYRVHEFTKVEMFAWTLPDEADSKGEGNFATTERTSWSEELFAEMVDIQKAILKSLGLHCRVLSMPSTDLGASATRKIDIEAFFPSRRSRVDGWGEVTSASICTDHQSRRLATRVKSKGKGGSLDFPHTLNGTALAVPRVIAALLENGWNEERQAVHIPQALRQWMCGREWIERE